MFGRRTRIAFSCFPPTASLLEMNTDYNENLTQNSNVNIVIRSYGKFCVNDKFRHAYDRKMLIRLYR